MKRCILITMLIVILLLVVYLFISIDNAEITTEPTVEQNEPIIIETSVPEKTTIQEETGSTEFVENTEINMTEPIYTVIGIEDKMHTTNTFNGKDETNVKRNIINIVHYTEPVTVCITSLENGWPTTEREEHIRYVKANENTYHRIRYITPIKYVYKEDLSGKYAYLDSTCEIVLIKEWYENAYVYAAHLKFTDYKRFSVECANGKYNSGRETTSDAADRIDAILCVNGDYAVPYNGAGGYAIARNGIVCNDKNVWSEGIYNNNTGILAYRTHDDCSGKQLSKMVAAGKITDTFQFGPAFLLEGKITGVDKSSTSRAQRTFIGTNGDAGNIWICVSDGRYNDGESAGLNGYQCAAYLKSKGCTFGIPLDGGGSSTFVWKGTVLNAAKGNERAVVDFICFK